MQPHGSSEAACQRGYASSHNTSSIQVAWVCVACGCALRECEIWKCVCTQA